LRCWSIRRTPATAPDDAGAAVVDGFPRFLLVFIALMTCGSFLVWPGPLADAAALVSRMCLLTAIAALGLMTHTGSLMRLGWRPVLLMIVLTLVVASVAGLCVSVGALV